MRLILFKILDLLKNLLTKLGINRRIPEAARIYDFLFKKFWPYPEIIEVQGSKMYLNIKNESSAIGETFSVYALNKIHERSTTELFKKIVEKGNVVIDLGANIGYFTLLASKLVGPEGKVFAFEPEPKNFSYLKKNIEINNYSYTFIFQKAVSNENGKTTLYICSYDTGHHTINQSSGIEAYSRGRIAGNQSIEIETVTLDSFLKGKTDYVNVIKMDVEGAEMLALLGMDRILRENKNIKMFVEFFPLLIEKMGSSPREFLRKILQDYGFSIYVIPDDYDALIKKMKKLNSVDKVMSYRKKEEDHINLFLKREI